MDMEKEDWVKKIQEATLEHNSVAQIAHKEGRDYIMPEDITEAFKTNAEDKVRLDVLEIMSDNAGFSYEAGDVCAFVAFKGKQEE